MNCGTLSYTGLDGLALFAAAILAICLVVGGAFIVATRRHRRGSDVLAAAILLVGATVGLSTLGASPATAATAAVCPAPASENSLTITQISVLAGLEPGAAPIDIFGTVTNNSDEETYIDDIEVSITAVTLAPGAVGTCTLADFVLLNPVMPVDATLPPYGTLTFGGASIGLVDAPWNQDACQDATVELSYATIP